MGRTRRPPTWPFPSLSSIAIACHAFRTPGVSWPPKRCFLLFGHLCRLFLGPGFRLAARWNRLVKTGKTREKRGKTGEKWARYGLKNVNQGS